MDYVQKDQLFDPKNRFNMVEPHHCQNPHSVGWGAEARSYPLNNVFLMLGSSPTGVHSLIFSWSRVYCFMAALRCGTAWEAPSKVACIKIHKTFFFLLTYQLISRFSHSTAYHLCVSFSLMSSLSQSIASWIQKITFNYYFPWSLLHPFLCFYRHFGCCT